MMAIKLVTNTATELSGMAKCRAQLTGMKTRRTLSHDDKTTLRIDCIVPGIAGWLIFLSGVKSEVRTRLSERLP